MTIPTLNDSRRRDDGELRKRVSQLRQRMREQGIQEQRSDWRDLAKATAPATAWTTLPTGTGLVKRLAEPLRLLFDAARMLILSGPEPEALTVRGAGMGPQAVLLDISRSPSVPLEWSLPADGDAPMIRLRVYRQQDGAVMLNCTIPDFPPDYVRIDLRESSGAGSFRGRLGDLLAGDIAIGAGAWTLKLTFTHKTPSPVREVPIDVGVLPGA